MSFSSDYFADFNPQTALDMVRQTPGIALDAGEQRRGFSGAVGNVLIDGRRPSTKSQTLEAILTGIPARQVLRIELLRGAETAGDASGQALLVNVVRTPSGGAGVYMAGFEYADRGEVAPRGQFSYTGRHNQTDFGVRANYRSEYRSNPGDVRIVDASGALISAGLLPESFDSDEAALAGNLATQLFDGRIELTGQLNHSNFAEELDTLAFNADGIFTGATLIDFEDNLDGYEAGVNYERGLGPWTVLLTGLINRSVQAIEDVAETTNAVDELTALLEQSRRRENGETILRAAFDRRLAETHRIELGAEVAVNTLDAQLSLSQDVGAGPVPITIPNANVAIEEQRGEIFANHTWRPNAAWSVETRLAHEASTLTFTGDTNQTVELAFWKPSLQISRNLGDQSVLRARFYRDVGQLSFDDFVSAAGIFDNIIVGGNPNLMPQTSWRAELGADLRLPGDAALQLTLAQHWISDVADLVLVEAPSPNPGDPPIRFDAPGNIGDGKATSLDVSLSLPLTPFIPNSRLTLVGYLWDIEVTDPVTGAPRTATERPESEVRLNFRQDFPNARWAWGFEAYKQAEQHSFRFNEIDTLEFGPRLDVFVETTALPGGIKFRASALNLVELELERTRFFFTPDRTGSLDSAIERRRVWGNGPWFIFELSGTL